MRGFTPKVAVGTFMLAVGIPLAGSIAVAGASGDVQVNNGSGGANAYVDGQATQGGYRDPTQGEVRTGEGNDIVRGPAIVASPSRGAG